MLMDRYPSGLERSWFKGCQAFTDGIFGKLGYAVDVQLFHKVAAVCLNSFGAYMQLLSKKVSLLINKVRNTPGGIRTCDLRIRNPLTKNNNSIKSKDLQSQASGAYKPAYKENPKTAKNLAENLPADLAEIVAVWSKLPEHIKRTIQVLVRSV